MAYIFVIIFILSVAICTLLVLRPKMICLDKDAALVANLGIPRVIHSCTEEEKDLYKTDTHHYTDIFTNQLLAEFTDVVIVDETVYKVDYDVTILIASWDGSIACWQNAPTFETAQELTCGTEIFNSEGKLCSLVTAKSDVHYAISSFVNESGRVLSKNDWEYTEGNGIVYGNKVFSNRDDMRLHLKDKKLQANIDLVPVIYYGPIPRVIMFDKISELEISHTYIRGLFQVQSKPIML